MVQYGYPYPTNFYNPVPGYPFQVACENMLQETTGLGALRAAAQVYYNFTGQAGRCFDWLDRTKKTNREETAAEGQLYWKRLGQLDRTSSVMGQSYGDDWTSVVWDYQCCTEVYQPMPTNGVTDHFELPYQTNKTKYFLRCQRRWDGVTPRPN